MKLGETLDIYVSHVVACGKLCFIYVQTDFDQHAELEVLMQHAESDIKRGTGSNRVSIDSINVGDIFLAKYNADGSWYRAHISSINHDKGSVKVFFYDYGNTDEVLVTDLSLATSKYFSIPPQAQKCILGDLEPVDGLSWCDDEEQYLIETVAGEFTAEVLQEESVCTLATLRLFDTGTKSNVTEKIIGEGMGNKYDNRHTRQPKIQNTSLSNQKTYCGYITSAESPVDFYMQLDTCETDLENLHLQIEDFLNSSNCVDLRPSDYETGKFCVAKYHENESFYRAVVTNVIPSQGKCTVTFIDYGNSGEVDFTEMKVLPEKFCKYPGQAIHCCLNRENAANTIISKLLEAGDSIQFNVLSLLTDSKHVVDFISKSSSNVKENQISTHSQQDSTEEYGCRIVTLKPLQFDLSATHDVFITHVAEDGYFYCQLVRHGQLVTNLMTTLQTAEFFVVKENVEAGDVYVVRHIEDAQFYRALVTVCQNKYYQVRLVDFGKEIVVEKSQLFDIPPQFTKLPVQAFRCTVSCADQCEAENIVSLLSKYKDTKKSLLAKVDFRTNHSYALDLIDTSQNRAVKISELLGYTSDKTVVTTSASSIPSGSISVVEQLYVTVILSEDKLFGQLTRYPEAELQDLQQKIQDSYTSNDGIMLSDVNVGEVCCAMYSEDDTFYRSEIVSLSGSKAVIRFVDYGNVEEKEISDLFVLHPEFCKLPQQGITCLLSSYKGISKDLLEATLLEKELDVKIIEKTQDVYEVSLPDCPTNKVVKDTLKRFEVPQTSRIQQTRISPSVDRMSHYIDPVIKRGLWEEGLVTHVNSPSQFYVQLLSSEDELNTMMDNIEEYCSSSSDVLQSHELKLGTQVLAKYIEDGGWYRAQVTGKPNGDSVRVHFVDYGNDSDDNLGDLRRIKPNFLDLPIQVVECSLKGVDLGTWDQQHTDHFWQLVQDVRCKVYFHSESGKAWACDLYDSQNNCINETFGIVTGKLNDSFVPMGHPPVNAFAHDAPAGIDTAKKIKAIKATNNPYGEAPEGFQPPAAFSSRGTKSSENEAQWGGRGSREGSTFSTSSAGSTSRFGTGDTGGAKSFGESEHTGSNNFNHISRPQNRGFDRRGGEKFDKQENSGWTERSSGDRSTGRRFHEDSGGWNSSAGETQGHKPRDSGGRFGSGGSFDKSNRFRSDSGDSRGSNDRNRFGSGGGFDKSKSGGGFDKGNRFGSDSGERQGSTEGNRFAGGGSFDKRNRFQGDSGESRGSTDRSRGGFDKGDRIRGDSRGSSDRNRGFGKPSGESWEDEGNRGFGSDKERAGLGNQQANAKQRDWQDRSERRSSDERFGRQDSNDATKTNWAAGFENKTDSRKHETSTVSQGFGDNTRRDKIAPGNVEPKKMYKRVNLRENEYVDLFVAYILSPGKFWCQLEKTNDELEKLMDEINEDYGALGNDDLKPTHLTAGDPCCAQFSDDDRWYRAEIVSHSGGEVQVHFVDYGNDETTSLSKVRELRPVYMASAAYAFECSLFGVQPLDEEWSGKATEKFEEMTIEKKLVGGVIEKTEGKYVVELVDITTQIHGELIKLGLAKCLDLPLGNKSRQRRTSGASTGSKASTSSKTSTSSRKSATVTSDTRYRTLDVRGNQCIDVNVVYVQSPDLFWCQLTQHSDTLGDLMNKIANEYDSFQAGDLKLSKPEAQQACCAKYSADNSWYRSKIVSLGEGRALVKFVDYGNEESVSMDEVKLLLRHFMTLPAQAVACSLEGILPTGGKWTNDGIDLFKKVTEDRNLVATMVGSSKGVYSIKLVDLEKGREKDVAAELMKGGFARSVSQSKSTSASQKSTWAEESSQLDIIKMFQTVQVEVGKTYKVVASWAVNPFEFYCQLLESATDLIKMSEQLFEDYEALRLNEMVLQDATVGQACVAYYPSDGNWYRSIIMQVDDTDVTVKYIDYGNTAKVPLSKVKEMKPEFRKIPSQVLRCRLAGLESPSRDWNKQALQLLNKCFAQPVSITVCKEINGILHVDIVDRTGQHIASQVASIAGVKYTPEPAQGTETPQKIEEKADSVIVCCVKSKQDSLTLGETVAVQICHIDSPAKFWCQLESDKPALDQMMDELDAYYHSANNLKLPETALVNGTFCVAIFSEDNSYYRAVIKHVISKAEVEIWYLDYGNSETVDAENLRILKEEFTKVPAQAVQGCLTGMPGGDADLFRELTDGIILNATICGISSDKAEMGLITEDGANIAVQLATKFGKIVSDDNEKSAQDFPEFNIPPGQDDAYISEIVSPSKFFLQLASQGKELDEMADKLLSEYEALAPDERTPAEIVVGMPCCAKYSVDSAWYRAVVTSVTGNDVDVLFVDFGNTDVVSMIDIKTLPPQYRDIAVFALECSMANLAVPSDGWQESHVAKLREIAGDGANCLKVQFLAKTKPFEVEMMHDGLDVSTFFPRKESSVKDSSKTSYTSFVPPACECTATISHIETSGDFYLQLVNRKESLNEMLEKVKIASQKARKIEEQKMAMPCLAMYSKESVWCRASIAELLQDYVKVRFVDYGHSQVCQLSEIKSVPSELLLESPFAVRCQFSQLLHLEGASLKEGINKLQELTKDRALTAVFKGTTEPFIVELKDAEKNIEAEICQMLPTSSPDDVDVEVVQFSPLTPPAGRNQVYVTHVVDPGRLYVQLVKDEIELQEMMDLVDAVGETGTQLNSPRLHQACCAKFSEDKVWYRAVVEDISGKQVTVRFVDHGNSETTTTNNLKEATNELLEVSPMAILCELEGVRKPTDGWPEGMTDQIPADKVLVADFQTVVVPAKIRLWHNNVDINEVLSAALPEGSEPDRVMKVSLKPCEEQSVFISFVQTPSNFYVNLTSQSEELEVFQNELQDSYAEDTPDDAVSDPKVGLLCCARYSEDQLWYRALIKQVLDTSCDVLFIDYGNTESVQKVDLRILKSRFTQQTAFAINCQLKGFTRDHPWTADQVQLLSDQLEQKLSATFITPEEPHTVQLYSNDVDFNALFPAEETTPTADTLPQTDTFKLKTLAVGVKEMLTVTHVDSPSQFWCQQSEAEAELQRLTEQILNSCEHDGSKVFTQADVKLDVVCAAKWSDEWCRGRIVGDLTEDKVPVYMIDFGDTEQVSLDDLRHLPADIAQTQPLAVTCVLAGVRPKEDDWTDEGVARFEELVLHKKVLAEVTLVSDFGSSGDSNMFYVVKLLEMGISTALTMLEEGHAMHSASPVHPSKSKLNTPVRSGPPRVHDNTVGVKRLDFSAADPESRQHIALDIPHFNLTAGSRLEVFISHVETPSRFWIQPKTTSSELESLSESLQKFCSENPPGDATFDDDQLCIAKSVEDGFWYRATVKNNTPDGVSVFYLDYGNSETLPASNLMPLNEKFSVLTRQAIECSLLGVRSPGTCWNSEASDALLDETLDKVLVAEATNVSHGNLALVKLLDMGLSVAQKLVDAGVAVDDDKAPLHGRQTPERTSVESGKAAVRYTYPDLQVGQHIEVFVTSVQSPSNFWCQLAKTSTTDLPLLNDQLQDYYCLDEPANRPTVFQPDMPCVAPYSDDRIWYRAKITSVGDDIQVCFVDYGNMDTVSSSDIRVIHGRFTDLPIQAFLCTMSCIAPVSAGNWDEASCVRFEELAMYDDSKPMTLEVVDIDKTESGAIVQVDGILRDNSVSLASSLVDGGYAHSVRPVEIAPGIPSALDVIEIVNDVIQNAVATITKTDHAPPKPKIEDSPPDEQLDQLTDTTVSKTLNQVAMELQGFSCMEFDNNLVVMQYLSGRPNEMIMQVIDSAGLFRDLMADIRDHCEQSTKEEESSSIQKSGQVCLVKCPETYNWYRGQVLEHQQECCKVKLVDYGKEVSVTYENVRPHPIKFIQLPVQTITCCLADLDIEDWCDEAQLYFEELVQDKELSGHITSQADHVFNMYVYDLDDLSGSSVNSLLVKKGYARGLPSNELQDEAHNNQNELETSFLDVSIHRSNSLGEFVDPLNVETSDEEAYAHLSFHPGEKVEACVLSAIDPGHLILQPVAMKIQFLALMDKLEQIYQDADVAALVSVQPRQPCCVRSDTTGSWCRGLVQSVEEDTIRVSLVDFGSEETVGRDDIRLLEQEFMALPVQHLNCRLAGITPTAETWSDETKDLLFKILCKKPDEGDDEIVTATVHELVNDKWNIDISSSGRNVRDILVQEGVAALAPETVKRETTYDVTQVCDIITKQLKDGEGGCERHLLNDFVDTDELRCYVEARNLEEDTDHTHGIKGGQLEGGEDYTIKNKFLGCKKEATAELEPESSKDNQEPEDVEPFEDDPISDAGATDSAGVERDLAESQEDSENFVEAVEEMESTGKEISSEEECENYEDIYDEEPENERNGEVEPVSDVNTFSKSETIPEPIVEELSIGVDVVVSQEDEFVATVEELKDESKKLEMASDDLSENTEDINKTAEASSVDGGDTIQGQEETAIQESEQLTEVVTDSAVTAESYKSKSQNQDRNLAESDDETQDHDRKETASDISDEEGKTESPSEVEPDLKGERSVQEQKEVPESEVTEAIVSDSAPCANPDMAESQETGIGVKAAEEGVENFGERSVQEQKEVPESEVTEAIVSDSAPCANPDMAESQETGIGVKAAEEGVDGSEECSG